MSESCDDRHTLDLLASRVANNPNHRVSRPQEPVTQGAYVLSSSKASLTKPNDGMSPAARTPSAKAQEVNGPDSTGRYNTGLLEWE